jgi:biopolymer transport protein ExbB
MFGDMSLMDLLRVSPTLGVLLLTSVVTLGFALERGLYFRSSAINVRRLMQDLSPKLLAGEFDAALQISRKQKGSAARVLEQAIGHRHLPIPQLQQRINTAIELEQVEMERNLGVLGTLSNIGPLIGLFGTVIGIIRAFADIARTGSGGSSVVAMGVAEALITTAVGIVIAVVATIFFNVFVRRIRTRIAELEDVREEFFSLMTQRTAAPERPVHSQPARRAPTQEPAPAGFLS